MDFLEDDMLDGIRVFLFSISTFDLRHSNRCYDGRDFFFFQLLSFRYGYGYFRPPLVAIGLGSCWFKRRFLFLQFFIIYIAVTVRLVAG